MDTLDQKIQNWRQCFSTEMSNHFNKFDPSTSGQQFERLTVMYLKPEDISELFPSGSGDVNFNIMLGLDCIASPPEAFTFRPIITAGTVKKEFQFKLKSDKIQTSEQVPFEFKEWLTANWLELDNQLFADSFTAYFEEAPGILSLPKKRISKRLNGYYYSDELNPNFWRFINDNRGRIEQFIFHLGIDMNKFNHKSFFNFTPVFELHITKADVVSIHRRGLRSHQIENTEVVYYEFNTPCPTTCPENTANT